MDLLVTIGRTYSLSVPRELTEDHKVNTRTHFGFLAFRQELGHTIHHELRAACRSHGLDTAGRAVLAAYGWSDLEFPAFTTATTPNRKQALVASTDDVIDRLSHVRVEPVRAERTASGASSTQSGAPRNLRAAKAKADGEMRSPAVRRCCSDVR